MKRLLSVILLAGLVLSITGCYQYQNTETSIVVGKNNSALMEKAMGDGGRGILIERISAPETYQNDVSSENGHLNVIIDAVVTVPDTEKVPIIQVTDGRITQEQADVLMDSLVHNSLYAFDRQQTKEEVMERILAAQEELNAGPVEDEEHVSYYIVGIGDVSWEEKMEWEIDELYDQYETALEAEELEPISGKFIQSGKANNLEYIMGSGISDIGYEELVIYNTSNLGGSTAFYTRNTAKNDNEQNYQFAENLSLLNKQLELKDFPILNITEDEAIALCDNLVEQLDIPNMVFYSINKKYNSGDDDVLPRCCWVLQYTRCFDGIPITYTSSTGGVIVIDDDEKQSPYSESWYYEKLTFYVNDDGIVDLEWHAPYEIGEVVVEDAELLPFTDIMDVFENMCVIQFAGQEVNITINDIRLGYMRILDKGDIAILVPVWDFFGTITDNCGEAAIGNDPEYSFLTINAIDGLVINRDFGY